MPHKERHIFIVDDDESICRALKYLLMTFGFTVSTYSSSEEFFVFMPNDSRGCLILDIHMPGLDGWGVLKKIKKSWTNLSVIIITADKDGDLKENAINSGAVGFLQKPFDDQALVNLIELAF